MRGVPKYKVVLEEHSEAWAEEFEQTKRLLESAHGDNVMSIEHVGSTAIPGIVAKPMLDVAVLLREITDTVFEVMRDRGYEYFAEVAEGKHLFILRAEDQSSLQHIHCYGENARRLFDEQVRFRDFLRAHAEYAREYELLKQNLCRLYANDRKKYTAGKQAFFDRIKALAEQEGD